MTPINIEIKIHDNLIKEFILDIAKTLNNNNSLNHEKSSISYIQNFNTELLTIKDVSKILKTNEPTIRNLINKGYIKALKLERLKIRNVEVERFLEWEEGKDFTDLNNVKELEFN